MSNVIHPTQFDRPPVYQPCPRRRKGTISFRRAGACLRLKREDLRESNMAETRTLQAQETVSKVMRRMVQEDARDADVLPVYLPNTGRSAFAILHTLKALGIELEFDLKRQGVVLRTVWDQPRPPAA